MKAIDQAAMQIVLGTATDKEHREIVPLLPARRMRIASALCVPDHPMKSVFGLLDEAGLGFSLSEKPVVRFHAERRHEREQQRIQIFGRSALTKPKGANVERHRTDIDHQI